MAVPKLCEVLSARTQKCREFDLAVLCEQCRQEHALLDCKTAESDDVRTYRCPKTNEPLIVIARPDTSAAHDNRGYNTAGWAIRNAVPFEVFVGRGAPRAHMPACENAILP